MIKDDKRQITTSQSGETKVKQEFKEGGLIHMRKNGEAEIK